MASDNREKGFWALLSRLFGGGTKDDARPAATGSLFTANSLSGATEPARSVEPLFEDAPAHRERDLWDEEPLVRDQPLDEPDEQAQPEVPAPPTVEVDDRLFDTSPATPSPAAPASDVVADRDEITPEPPLPPPPDEPADEPAEDDLSVSELTDELSRITHEDLLDVDEPEAPAAPRQAEPPVTRPANLFDRQQRPRAQTEVVPRAGGVPAMEVDHTPAPAPTTERPDDGDQPLSVTPPPPENTDEPDEPTEGVSVHDDRIDRRPGPIRMTPSEALALAKDGPSALKRRRPDT